ncbi:MAG TPA: aminoglycoside adenylyltransferase domain-containing protein [Pyrinomonadaceae bacterium]|nr:aminoglycoside adenylyltransferase domain-containing protein [Pyrinomonadaceae bacterium]
MKATHPTPYADVNTVLLEILSGVQTILGSRFIGFYLFGSLASGDFDRDSDVDFIVVSEIEISPDLFSALQAMHARIATIASWCATQLDGSYISHHALRRYDPANAVHPHIDRGVGENLRMMQHDSDWMIQRHNLREQGLVVAGPGPQTLIDAVLPRELRQAVLDMLHSWLAPMIDDPAPLKTRGYQSYIVLTLCRMLYTLEFGTVVSKPVAARWARETLGERWAPLIEHARVGRQHPRLEAEADDVNATLDFVRYTIERSQLVRDT